MISLDNKLTRRIMALQALQREIQVVRHEAAVGSVLEVLADSVSRRLDGELGGRTSGNMVVTFPGPAAWLGQLLPVRITGASPHGLRGVAFQPGVVPDRL